MDLSDTSVMTKRSKITAVERKERRRVQNNRSANRYRIKKREEINSIDELEEGLNDINERLKSQLQKLVMEFNVVYSLAKSAFAAQPLKAFQLQKLDIRLLHNLGLPILQK